MIRLFVPDDLDEGGGVSLGPERAHYLRDVMRRGVGDEVALFNGRDGEWRAAVAEVGKRSVGLALRERTRAQGVVPDLELVVALVKRPRLETIVEKATELGVRRVRLAVTQFTQADRVKLDRLTAIAVEAAEQTGRLDIPEVVAPQQLDAILDGWPARTLIFCDEAGDAKPMLDSLLPSWEKVAAKPTDEGPRRRSQPGSMALAEGSARPLIRPGSARPPSPTRGEGTSILIGPEGGFSPDERARLRGLPCVIPVSLGPRILRADTAAIAALALWQAAIGDWSP